MSSCSPSAGVQLGLAGEPHVHPLTSSCPLLVHLLLARLQSLSVCCVCFLLPLPSPGPLLVLLLSSLSCCFSSLILCPPFSSSVYLLGGLSESCCCLRCLRCWLRGRGGLGTKHPSPRQGLRLPTTTVILADKAVWGLSRSVHLFAKHVPNTWLRVTMFSEHLMIPCDTILLVLSRSFLGHPHLACHAMLTGHCRCPRCPAVCQSEWAGCGEATRFIGRRWGLAL